MKNPKAPRTKTGLSKDKIGQLKEDAAQYGLRREFLGVREAKDQFSQILKRAADGEQIVICSDGVPMAMVVRYRPALGGKPFRVNWELLNSMPMTPDSTPDIRADRDSGP